jgi:hypothetical protein
LSHVERGFVAELGIEGNNALHRLLIEFFVKTLNVLCTAILVASIIQDIQGLTRLLVHPV